MNPAQLADAVRAAMVRAISSGDLRGTLPDEIGIDRPRSREHGDYATPVALKLAKSAGLPPRAIAEVLARHLTGTPGISSVEVAGPGFLNIRLDIAAAGAVVGQVVAAGAGYGSSDALAGKNINLEFVSANPTGPVHIGGARWAAVGDALGRVLGTQGATVVREYYFNDAGAQIDRFARSLLAAARSRPTPEDGYGGDYIHDIADRISAAHPGAAELSDEAATEVYRSEGVAQMFGEIKNTLHEFRTDFDVYFHEDSLHRSGAVRSAVDRLKNSGHLFEADGAWWLKSTDYGDDKDRVVIKSDGEPAYIAGDLAYFLDKRSRGFDLCIYMLGADHHGYISRLKAAAAAFGDDPGVVEVLIGQMVFLVAGGEPVRMSKRAGTVDLARRPDRGAGCGRRPVLADPLLGGHHAGPGPGPVDQAEFGQPRLLRAVRPRPVVGAGPVGARTRDRSRVRLRRRAAGHPAGIGARRAARGLPADPGRGRRAARAAPGGAVSGGPGVRLPQVLRRGPGAAHGPGAGEPGQHRPALAVRCGPAGAGQRPAVLGVTAPERM